MMMPKRLLSKKVVIDRYLIHRLNVNNGRLFGSISNATAALHHPTASLSSSSSLWWSRGSDWNENDDDSNRLLLPNGSSHGVSNLPCASFSLYPSQPYLLPFLTLVSSFPPPSSTLLSELFSCCCGYWAPGFRWHTTMTKIVDQISPSSIFGKYDDEVSSGMDDTAVATTAITTTTSTTPLSPTSSSSLLFSSILSSSSSSSSSSSQQLLVDIAIWLIKRTYQPSLLRKKRKSGYLKRRQTVGGRKILKRRRAKGRARLFGA